MAEVRANSMACHPRATCHITGCCHLANSVACHPRATSYHIARSCHLVIHCHDSTATCHTAGCTLLAKSMSWSCHIAGCKNSIRLIKPPLATAKAACERIGAIHLFVCLSVCLLVCLTVAKMQKMRFSQKLSNLELWSLLTTYMKLYVIGLFKEPIIGPLKSRDGWNPPSWKPTWRHFFCQGWSDLDKISETGAEWHVDCDDVVEIETRCRNPIWRTFWRIQWHVIPEPRITLQGAATWWIHCHDSRATCHIAGCKNSICHVENRFLPYFIFFCF